MDFNNEVIMTDEELSEWLIRNGWKGKVNKPENTSISEFISDDGQLLIKVLYDNTKSTRRIFMNLNLIITKEQKEIIERVAEGVWCNRYTKLGTKSQCAFCCTARVHSDNCPTMKAKKLLESKR